MITTATVNLDKQEYCRYEPANSHILATVLSNGSFGDSLTWSVERTDGFGLVAMGTYVLQSANFILSIDLNSLADADGLNFATAGEYILRFTSGSWSTTVPFTLSLITIDEFKRRWIYGVNLEASDILAPVVPLRLLTGITYVDSSRDIPPGAFSITFTPAVGPTLATISIDGGTPVPVLSTGIQDLVFVVACESGWVKLRVNPALLPSVSTTELLFLDRAKMDDPAIQAFIRNAASFVESYVHFSIEPRMSSTNLLWRETNKPFVDSFVSPVSWTAPYNFDTWLTFHVPLRRLLKVYDVRGYFNSSLSTVIPVNEWETHDEYTGIITFIPRSGGALVTWQTVQATFMQFMFARDIVQEFWHYRVAHGLRDLSIAENQPVRDAIARKASIDVLLQAGSAMKAGIASESVSRDGVSESTSYTQSAMYGLYSHITMPYQDWLDENLPRLKRRLGGVEFVTL